MPSAASGCRPLLRIPGTTAFFLSAALGRVGIAMTGIGLVWLLHARTGSYGTAGFAASGFALAEALVGPQLAGLIDRFGQTRILPFSLLAHGLAMAGVLTFTVPAAAVAAACCAGASIPQLGALSGARWAHLLRDGRDDELPTTFSLESLANASAFLLGPVPPLARAVRRRRGSRGPSYAGPAERPHGEVRTPGGPHPGVHLEQLRELCRIGAGGIVDRPGRGRVGRFCRIRARPSGWGRPAGARDRRPPKTRLSHRQATRLSRQQVAQLSRQQECTYCGFA
ncbi:hypothetical protein ACOKM3_03225 [Streptomyces sp. BH106]|uniref:hypothetical protein n=1 Tax=Streptomyces sp. BH106 TaxID=3410409 RepID=UPI003CF5F3FA